jgi:hypothetical protein
MAVAMPFRLGTSRTLGEVQPSGIPLLEDEYDVAGVERFALIGDAPKNYLISRASGEAHAYIAKGPRREGPIECVTEHLISRIGRQLPLAVAEGRLVRLPTARAGAVDIRFLSRQFLDRAQGEQLVHGSELVAGCFEMQDKELEREIPRGGEWAFYTVDLVDEVLAHTAKHGEHEDLRASFARMMAFDALVGANDRHAQNWGVIKNARRIGPLRFAPVFDTARGLFWNSSEARLLKWDEAARRQQEIERYARHSLPLIGFETAQRPNHFDVIAHMVRDSRFRTPILHVLRAYDPAETSHLLHVEFRRILSRRRLEYIDGLLRLRHATLIEVSEP